MTMGTFHWLAYRFRGLAHYHLFWCANVHADKAPIYTKYINILKITLKRKMTDELSEAEAHKFFRELRLNGEGERHV